jgi:hypothetical protein
MRRHSGAGLRTVSGGKSSCRTALHRPRSPGGVYIMGSPNGGGRRSAGRCCAASLSAEGAHDAQRTG